MREMYGLLKGERILHTAHRTTTSHMAWERLCQMLHSAGIPYEALKASGRERIDVAEGGRVEFRTRTSTGGLGEGFDLLVIDEAQEYTDDQESALKYVVTDSKNPQTIFCGTPPTPISSGTVFLKFRGKTLNGGAKNAGWAEWSVDRETDPHDVEAWYRTNPSLGTIFTERSVEDEIGGDVTDFNIQRLGLWLKYNQKSAIQQTDWDALRVSSLPDFRGKLFAGVKYGADGENVVLSVAIKLKDDTIFVEAIDCRPAKVGNDWIVAFLKHADVRTVVIDGAGSQSILAKELKVERVKAQIILPTVKDIIVANRVFEQAVYQQTVRHAGQPSLSQVATNCEKRKIGTNGGFGYRSQLEDYDISLLDSVLLAHWACLEAKPIAKQRIAY